MRVLVADDDKTTRRMLAHYLHTWGYTITLAANGALAWRAFQQEPFCLVLTDWLMPDMTGIELIAAIRAHPAGHATHIILLTAKHDPIDLIHGFEVGANDVIHKPFNHLELRVRIQAGARVAELEDRLACRNQDLENLNAELREKVRESEQNRAELQARGERFVRHQRALIELTRNDLLETKDLAEVFRALTAADARALQADRVSIWRFGENGESLRCVELYQLAADSHSQGMVLQQQDYPDYFRALATSEIISAHDARADPRTREFRDGYLQPNGISSMMDVPLYLFGRLEGVLCHEHVGPPRRWFPDEEMFGMGVANLVTLAVGQWERHRAEDTLQQVAAELHASNEQLNTAAENLKRSVDSEREAHQTLRLVHEELKLTQTKMMQSERLASLGQMVAGVAHEINNPLAFVHNNFAVLQRDLPEIAKLFSLYRESDTDLQQIRPDLAQRIARFAEDVDIIYALTNLQPLLERTREGLRRIQQIVKDLRDFARLDSGQRQPANLNVGIESTLNIVRGLARRQEVSILSELEPLPPVVCCSSKINQVVMNLVVNALDASRRGGCVVVRTLAHADAVEIHVIDSGCGIDPAIRARVLDPFFTTKPVGKGTGLGLSISYGIITDHGGELDFTSELGVGTHFIVRLPLIPPGF